MSVENIGLYRPDGRLRGTYVYMLLCRDDGPIYVKVGITDRPDERLLALRHGCPVTPLQYCTMEVASRRKARVIEIGLHESFRQWRAHGEWFRVNFTDKTEFNAGWRKVLARHATNGWPGEWSRVAVQPVIAAKQRAARYRLHIIRKRGTSFRDFRRDQVTS